MLDYGLFQFVHTRNFAARIENIGKNHRRAAKHIIFQCHTFINRNIVLNFHTVADNRFRADYYVLPNLTVLSNARTFQNVRNVPNTGAFTNFNTVINKRRFMCEVITLALR